MTIGTFARPILIAETKPGQATTTMADEKEQTLEMLSTALGKLQARDLTHPAIPNTELRFSAVDQNKNDFCNFVEELLRLFREVEGRIPVQYWDSCWDSVNRGLRAIKEVCDEVDISVSNGYGVPRQGPFQDERRGQIKRSHSLVRSHIDILMPFTTTFRSFEMEAKANAFDRGRARLDDLEGFKKGAELACRLVLQECKVAQSEGARALENIRTVISDKIVDQSKTRFGRLSRGHAIREIVWLVLSVIALVGTLFTAFGALASFSLGGTVCDRPMKVDTGNSI